VLTVLLERLPGRARLVRPFAAVGVLGGWTTYSTLVVESVALVRAGHASLAGGYLAATLVCGMTAAALGIGLGRSRARSSPGEADSGARGDEQAPGQRTALPTDR
jgi:CrcB protein